MYSRPAFKHQTQAAFQRLYGRNEPELDTHHRYSKNAQVLRKSGVLTAMPLLEQLGSPSDYQAWSRGQPCILTKCFDVNREGQTENFFYVVKMGRIKPGYAGVPVLAEIASLIDQQGILPVLNSYQQDCYTIESASQWLIMKAWNNLHAWSWLTLKDVLGYQHWYDIPPKVFYQWAESNGINYLIPKPYLVTRDER